MLQRAKRSPRQTKLGNAWGALEAICRKVHGALYERRDVTSARRYRRRLEQILGQLPENDLAIVREEGLALLHELRGELTLAIPHRQREIGLMMKLHRSVKRSIARGDYDARTGQTLLVGRDQDALKERREILKGMQRTAKTCETTPDSPVSSSVRDAANRNRSQPKRKASVHHHHRQQSD